MGRPNYAFAKHQREIAKRQKKEAKRLKKADLRDDKEVPDSVTPPAGAPDNP